MRGLHTGVGWDVIPRHGGRGKPWTVGSGYFTRWSAGGRIGCRFFTNCCPGGPEVLEAGCSWRPGSGTARAARDAVPPVILLVSGNWIRYTSFQIVIRSTREVNARGCCSNIGERAGRDPCRAPKEDRVETRRQGSGDCSRHGCGHPATRPRGSRRGRLRLSQGRAFADANPAQGASGGAEA